MRYCQIRTRAVLGALPLVASRACRYGTRVGASPSEKGSTTHMKVCAGRTSGQGKRVNGDICSKRAIRGGGGGGGGRAQQDGGVESKPRGACLARAMPSADTATGPSSKTVTEDGGHRRLCWQAGTARKKTRATAGARTRCDRLPCRWAPGRSTEVAARQQLGEGSGTYSRSFRVARAGRTVLTTAEDSDLRRAPNTPTSSVKTEDVLKNLMSTRMIDNCLRQNQCSRVLQRAGRYSIGKHAQSNCIGRHKPPFFAENLCQTTYKCLTPLHCSAEISRQFFSWASSARV